jgi:hypothetical protein
VFISLAQNIYGSNARFVFELLQNADDNNFSRAKASGALPFVSFQVHPDRIIVECNEDGFTVDNLNALCSVGESTKSASHGYIGAKGIGFKSVFIAAWKVEIQSGPFSFYFKHERGDLGLGMVLPVWMEAESAPQGPLTRMTLHLHQKGDREQLRHLRDTVFRQLAELQQTCLLFLHNLRQINVAFFDEEGELKTSKEYSVRDLGRHRVDLETISRNPVGTTATDKKHYHVTRHLATNLSRSEGRELPSTEDANISSSSAEVVLAFPLTADSKPLLASQHVFAFLPVRESGFKVGIMLCAIFVGRRVLTVDGSSSSSPISTPQPVGRTYSQPRCATSICVVALLKPLSWPCCSFARTLICATPGRCSFPRRTVFSALSGASCGRRSKFFCRVNQS